MDKWIEDNRIQALLRVLSFVGGIGCILSVVLMGIFYYPETTVILMFGMIACAVIASLYKLFLDDIVFRDYYRKIERGEIPPSISFDEYRRKYNERKYA